MDTDLARMKRLFQNIANPSVNIGKDDVKNAMCHTTGRIPYMDVETIDFLIEYFKDPPRKPLPNFQKFIPFMADNHFPFVLADGGLQLQRFKTVELLFDHYNRTDPIDFDNLKCTGGSGAKKNNPTSKNPILSGPVGGSKNLRSQSRVDASGNVKKRLPDRTARKRDSHGNLKLD